MDDKFAECDRHYISLLQENINRMASNSANCKTWLITLVAAITALQLAKNDLRSILWVALGLIVLFYVLDCYYLSLERKFIVLERDFISIVKAKTHEDGSSLTDGLYSFDLDSVVDKNAKFWVALGSWSTWPFYLALFLTCFGICIWPQLFS